MLSACKSGCQMRTNTEHRPHPPLPHPDLNQPLWPVYTFTGEAELLLLIKEVGDPALFGKVILSCSNLQKNLSFLLPERDMRSIQQITTRQKFDISKNKTKHTKQCLAHTVKTPSPISTPISFKHHSSITATFNPHHVACSPLTPHLFLLLKY